MVLILYLWDYYRNWVLFHTLISYKFSSFVKCLFKTLANSWIISHFFVDLFYNCIFGYEDLPDSSVGKESTCNAGDPSSIPGLGRSAGEGISYPLQYSWASLVAQPVKKSACNAGDMGSIPELGRSPGEGKGHPLQYSGLENSMDRGTSWATVQGVVT